MKKILFTIIDGLGDRPTKKLKGQTPLEAATTPNLDFLAQAGRCGLLTPLPGEKHPTSEEAHFAIFGFWPDYFPGRGPLEALGINVALQDADIAFRVNFGTVNESFKVVDPRAGRIDSVRELCSAISPLVIKGVKFFLYPSLGHRAVLVMRGEGISAQVSGNDPHKLPPYKINIQPPEFRSLDRSKEGEFTAQILKTYIWRTHRILKKHPLNYDRESRGLLPANYLLIREPGQMKLAPSFFEKYRLRACCIAGAPLYKGIARFLGMVAPDIPGTTGDTTTNLEAKIARIKKAFETYDFVFLHIKGADLLGEDKNCLAKKEFIERIDRAFSSIISRPIISNLLIVVTGDHSTPCEIGAHSGDPIPFLIFDNKNKDRVRRFGESYCRKGSLGRIIGGKVMPLILKLTESKNKKG